MNFKSILAIGAHPDDIELACFGFLLKQQKLGSKIYAFIASPDSLTNNPKTLTRIEESQKSFKLIPESILTIRDKNNINMENYQEIGDQIRNIILDNNIDTVIVHSNNDTMQEHRLLHDITITACRRLPLNILLFKSPSSEVFQTNLIVNIENEYETKILAIKQHSTQLNKPYLFDDSLTIFNQSWIGKKMGFNKTEEFIVYRIVM